MTLTEILEWLETQVDCHQFYVGKVGAASQSITIYNFTGSAPRIAIGGLDNTSYTNKVVSLLVHWGKNPSMAERKAKEVYDAMFGKTAVIGGKRVIMFDMRTSEPIGVGTDSEGNYEYVIEVNIIHER